MACKVLKNMDLINSYLESTKTRPEKTLNLSKWKRKLQAIPSPKDGDSDIFLEEIREFIEVIISSICSKNKKHVQQFHDSRAGFVLLQNILEDNSRQHLISNIAKLVFDVIIEENTDCWLAKRELLRVFNKWFGTIKKIVNIKPLPGIYLLKMVDSLTVTGDYDLQLNILETIFRMYGQEINERLRDMIPESQELSQSFSEIHPDTFDEDCRKFLNVINRKTDKIFSLVCANVQLDGTSCDPPLDNIDGFWVDFNTIDKAITWHYVGPSYNDSIWDLLMLFPSEINTVLVGSKKFPESYAIQFLLKGHLVTTDVKATEVIGKVKEVTFIISRSEGAEKLINEILPKILENLIPESVKPQASSSPEGKIYKPLDIKISKNQRRRSVSSITSTANFNLSFDASLKTYKILSSEEENDTRNISSIKDHNDISEESNDDILNSHSIESLASKCSFLSSDFNLTIENEENTQRPEFISNASPPKQESYPKVSSLKPYKMTEGSSKSISKFSKPIEQKVNSKTNHLINRHETIEEDTRDIHKNKKSLNTSKTLNTRRKEKTQKTDREGSKNIPKINKSREQKNDIKKQNREELDRRANSFLNRSEIIEEDLIDTENNRKLLHRNKEILKATIKEDTQKSDPRISSSDQYETVNECPENIPKISRPVKQKVYPKRRQGEELGPMINSPPNRHKTVQEDPRAVQKIRKEKVLNIGSSENTHESDPRISSSDQYKTVEEYPEDISKIRRPIKLNPCLTRSLRGREVLSSKPISLNQREERRAHSSSFEYETAKEGTTKISKNIKDIGKNKIVLKFYPELTEDKTNLQYFNIPHLNQDSYPEITEDFDSLKVNIPKYANKGNINISDVRSIDDSMEFAEEIITSGKIIDIPNSIENNGSKYCSQEVVLHETDVYRDNNHSGRPQILSHIVIAPAMEDNNSHSKIKPTLENEEEDAEKENLHEDVACTYNKVDVAEAKENKSSLEVDKQEEILRVNSRIENSSLKIVKVKKMLKTYPAKNKNKLKNGSESKKALFKNDQNSKEQNLTQLDEQSNIAKPKMINDFKCENVIEQTAAECKPDSKVASREGQIENQSEKFIHMDKAEDKEQLGEKISTNISFPNKSVSVTKKKYPKKRTVKPKKYRSPKRKRGDDSFAENEISNIQDSNQRMAEEQKTQTKVDNENINNSNSISLTDNIAIEYKTFDETFYSENKEERKPKIAKRFRSSPERESSDESSAENDNSHQHIIIRVEKIDIHNINSTGYMSHDTDVKHKELDRQHEKVVQKSELLKESVNILETQKREEPIIREKRNTSKEYLKNLKIQDNATDNKFVSKNLSDELDPKQQESCQGEKIDKFEITEATKMLKAKNAQGYSKRENKKPKRYIPSSKEESVCAENLTRNNATDNKISPKQKNSFDKNGKFVCKNLSDELDSKQQESSREKIDKFEITEATKMLEAKKAQRYSKRENKKPKRCIPSSEEEIVCAENHTSNNATDNKIFTKQENSIDKKGKFVSKNLSGELDSKQKESSQSEKIDEFEITEATKMLEVRNVQRYSKRENKKPKRSIQSSDEESVRTDNLTKNKFSKTEENKTSRRYSPQIESSNKSLEFVSKDISKEHVIKLEKSKRNLKKVVENTQKVKMSEESRKVLETEKSQRYLKRERKKIPIYLISSDEESVFSENSPKKNSKKKFNESCGRYPSETESTNKNIKEISDVKHNESNSQCKEGSSETENVKMAWIEKLYNNYRNIRKRNQKSKVDIDHEMTMDIQKIDTKNDVTENDVTDKIGSKTLLESPKSVVETGVSVPQRLTGESETIENIQKLIEVYDLPTQDYNSVGSIDGYAEHHEHDEIGKEDLTEMPKEVQYQQQSKNNLPTQDYISDSLIDGSAEHHEDDEIGKEDHTEMPKEAQYQQQSKNNLPTQDYIIDSSIDGSAEHHEDGEIGKDDLTEMPKEAQYQQQSKNNLPTQDYISDSSIDGSAEHHEDDEIEKEDLTEMPMEAQYQQQSKNNLPAQDYISDSSIDGSAEYHEDDEIGKENHTKMPKEAQYQQQSKNNLPAQDYISDSSIDGSAEHHEDDGIGKEDHTEMPKEAQHQQQSKNNLPTQDYISDSLIDGSAEHHEDDEIGKDHTEMPKEAQYQQQSKNNLPTQDYIIDSSINGSAEHHEDGEIGKDDLTEMPKEAQYQQQSKNNLPTQDYISDSSIDGSAEHHEDDEIGKEDLTEMPMEAQYQQQSKNNLPAQDYISDSSIDGSAEYHEDDEIGKENHTEMPKEAQYQQQSKNNLPAQDYISDSSIDGSAEHHEDDEIGKEDHTEIPIENEVQVNCVDGNEHIPDKDPISDISNDDINNENVTAEQNLEKYSLENNKTIEIVLSKEHLNPPIRDQQLWKNQRVVSFDVDSNNSSVRNLDLNQTGSSLIKPQEFNGGEVRSEVIEPESVKSNSNSSVLIKELNQTVPISKELVDIKQIYPKNTMNKDKKSKNPLDDKSKVTRGRQETKRRSVKEILEDLEKTKQMDKEPIENVKVVENKPIISKRDPRIKSFVNQNKDSEKLVEISDIVKKTVQNVKDVQAAPEKSSLLDEPKTNVTVKQIGKRNESISISMKTTKRNISKTRRSRKSKEMRKLHPFEFKTNNSKKTTTTKELLEEAHHHKKRMKMLEKSLNVSLSPAGSSDKFKNYFDIMLKSWKTGVPVGKYLNKDKKKGKKRDYRAVKDRPDKKELKTYSSTPHKKRSRFNIGDLDISEIPKMCNKEKSIRFSNVAEDTQGPEEYITATTSGLNNIVVQSDIPLKPWNHAPSPNIPTIEGEAALARFVLSAGGNNEIRRSYLPAFSDCAIGNPAPVWTADALFEDTIITINSSKFIGKYLVIFFYPLDFGVITKMDPPIELFDINENYEKFRQLNAEVVSCSVDSCYTHKAFLKYHCRNNNLPAVKLKFPLLADVTHKISRDYMVYSETLGHSCRGFAIINPKGILVAMNVAESTPPVLIEEIIDKITRCQLSYV